MLGCAKAAAGEFMSFDREGIFRKYLKPKFPCPKDISSVDSNTPVILNPSAIRGPTIANGDEAN
ncbi:MAG TPA: hypothetical protein VH481_00170 [Nitrososphaeraceae archaeon]